MQDSLDDRYGKIVVYCHEGWRGKTIQVYQNGKRVGEDDPREIYANVVGRFVDGAWVYTASFPKVLPGDCDVNDDDYYDRKESVKVTVFAGYIADVDFTERDV